MSLLLWVRCLFSGHESEKVPIVVTSADIRIHPAEKYPDAVLRLAKFKIESPLYFCRKCGRITFGP